MLKKPNLNSKGFSLAELLLAAAILAFVSSILLQAAIYTLVLNTTSRNSTSAITHAQYVMEDIRSKNINSTGFSNIISDINSGNWSMNPGNWNWNGATPPALLTNEKITTCCATGPTNPACTTCNAGATLLDVIVTVGWDDKTNRHRSTSLQTYFTQPP